MSFHQSWRERCAGQLDDLRADGSNRRIRPDGVDALAFHAHHPTVVRC
jgi:hypothetical protein